MKIYVQPIVYFATFVRKHEIDSFYAFLIKALK